MPNTKSAKKRLRQDTQRRLRNRIVKSAVRTQIRKVRQAVQAGDLQKAGEEFRLACKRLDRAGAHGVLHRNTASRYKSRLANLIKKAQGTPSAASSS
jgi:small subunit ribosomal protein S20